MGLFCINGNAGTLHQIQIQSKGNFKKDINSYKETDSSAHLVRYQNKQAQIKDEQDFSAKPENDYWLRIEHTPVCVSGEWGHIERQEETI